MKLQQLRFLCEVADHGYSFAKAAASLHTSQPGISKQIKLLEQELGVDLFVRNKGRVVEVTRPGIELIELARNVLREANRVKTVAAELKGADTGQFTVAATYMLARYALPSVYRRFVQRFPKVRLRLIQGSPDHVFRMAACGEADLAVSTRYASLEFDGALFDYCSLPRVLIAPKGHSLLTKRRIMLKHIAQFPLVRIGRHRMRDVFREAGLEPLVVFEDLEADIDVVKAFVLAGVGIAVLPEIAYDAKRDVPLEAISVSHLFDPHNCCIAVRRNHYLPAYMKAFIELLSPLRSGSTRARPDALAA